MWGVRQKYKSAFCRKQGGFKRCLPKQLQMSWQLNTYKKEILDRENNHLRNEK